LISGVAAEINMDREVEKWCWASHNNEFFTWCGSSRALIAIHWADKTFNGGRPAYIVLTGPVDHLELRQSA
jgi:hypothetical protein